MALTYIVPVRYCMNRGSANGAPAGGAFLVDIPEDWEPRAKQQPTGLIAYGTSCRRPVLVLHRPRKKSQVKRLGIFVVEHSPQQSNPKDLYVGACEAPDPARNEYGKLEVVNPPKTLCCLFSLQVWGICHQHNQRHNDQFLPTLLRFRFLLIIPDIPEAQTLLSLYESKCCLS